MELTEVIDTIENSLSETSGKNILKLCNDFFPEEDFGKVLSDGIIDDMFHIILEEAAASRESCKNIYFFLLNEKVTIDEEEFYSEEEINNG